MFEQEGADSSQEVQDNIVRAIKASIPERALELNSLFNDSELVFNCIRGAVEEEAPFHLEAGLYKHIWYSHRALRAIWVGVFGACDIYNSLNGANKKPLLMEKIQAYLDCVSQIVHEPDCTTPALPFNTPEPGRFVHEDSELLTAANLAVMALAWVMLHEFRHIKFQREGNSPANPHEEELMCDEYATYFLLERVPEYTEQSGEDDVLVRMKRALSIICAVFAMAAIDKSNETKQGTHPPIVDRLVRTYEILSQFTGAQEAALMGYKIFEALQNVWPEAPKIPDNIIARIALDAIT